jgi:hypothetical protein
MDCKKPCSRNKRSDFFDRFVCLNQDMNGGLALYYIISAHQTVAKPLSFFKYIYALIT